MLGNGAENGNKMKAHFSPNGKLLCLPITYPKNKQKMDGNIRYIFDYLAYPVVHLLILKSFMGTKVLVRQLLM